MRWRTEGDAVLDGVARIRQYPAEPSYRVLFDSPRRQVLGLEHDRRTERIAHDQIRLPAALDGAMLLGPETLSPSRVLRPQHAGERFVEGPLAVGRRHVDPSAASDVLRGGVPRAHAFGDPWANRDLGPA